MHRYLSKLCRNISVEIYDDYSFNEEDANDDDSDGDFEDEIYWLNRCLESPIQYLIQSLM